MLRCGASASGLGPQSSPLYPHVFLTSASPLPHPSSPGLTVRSHETIHAHLQQSLTAMKRLLFVQLTRCSDCRRVGQGPWAHLLTAVCCVAVDKVVIPCETATIAITHRALHGKLQFIDKFSVSVQWPRTPVEEFPRMLHGQKTHRYQG